MIVTIDKAVTGLVPNVPVIPAGHPLAAKVTAELKPFAGFAVMLDVPLEPGVADAAVELSVKLGCGAVPLTGPKNTPLATAFPLVAATVMVTFPLMFHTAY